MAGRIRFTFTVRMLLTILGAFWILVAIFMFFQYHREKEYRSGMMDSRLQMHNSRIIEDMRRGEDIASIVGRIDAPVPDLRVTLIDADGNVRYDSRRDGITANHNDRPEVMTARSRGEGFAIERLSESDDQAYFYSATAGDDGMVVRSAAPYTHSLALFLSADSTILWIMAGVSLIISLFVLIATNKISVSIRRLNMFARKAEEGKSISTEYAFPHDELGSIAHHIVRLYVQREEQFRENLRLEKDKTRLKKQLTNNINHELKTPVASILVSLDLLDDHPEIAEAKKAEIMRRIRNNASRLSSLLGDVSTLTKMDDAPEMIARADVDLTALVKEIAEESRARTDMRIEVRMPELHIEGNAGLLESVFRNLFDNAIAYSGGTEITVTADKEGRFRFQDNGRGVAAEHLPHIFERFYRVDDGRTRAGGGTGLGLAIVRNAIHVHGGEITARSVRGLAFEFTLPVREAGEED